ncbi:mycothiol maleylpyruvate isomerase, partial [Amycolatopsis rhizosphaerae]
AGSWARRQAHEAAIHRLNAEHALAGSADASAVPSLVFDPGFAADGIDELITRVLPTAGRWREGTVTGTVVLHAADAGQTWTVRVVPGEPPRLEHGGGLDADTTIAGTADAVYRRVWRRPSHAVVTGNAQLLEPLAGP